MNEVIEGILSSIGQDIDITRQSKYDRATLILLHDLSLGEVPIGRLVKYQAVLTSSGLVRGLVSKYSSGMPDVYKNYILSSMLPAIVTIM